MITLDASLVIAHLSAHDANHHRATLFLRESTTEVLLMHPLNLAEVLVGGVRAGRGQEMLEDLGAMGITASAAGESDPLALATLRAETALKLPDCCALATALKSGSALATFDDRLAQVATSRHVMVLPERPD